MDRLRPHTIFILTVAVVSLFAVATAHAAATPEQACQKGRYDAATKYNASQQKALGNYWAAPFDATYDNKTQVALWKSRVKYAATWAKLQSKASGTGSTCENPRYQDNGDGTVTDRLTALQWEKKTDDSTVHDKDDRYLWSTDADADVTDADGPAFTSFLAMLNGGACFAGQCDWRLPTIYELQTLLLQPQTFPCEANPCIDEAVFGPTGGPMHWSATTWSIYTTRVWVMAASDGWVDWDYKADSQFVRAVRGGL